LTGAAFFAGAAFLAAGFFAVAMIFSLINLQRALPTRWSDRSDSCGWAGSQRHEWGDAQPLTPIHGAKG
jgi:hypothetical protein